jgi:1-acyl-sn-glycerol-3-phosphate acyltransferase
MNFWSRLRRFIKVFTRTSFYLRKAYTIKDEQEEKQRLYLHSLMAGWGQEMLTLLRVDLRVSGEVASDETMLLVGNHVSYMDMPVLMAISPVVFIAKIELSRWPVIGSAARSVGTVFVDRESKSSRQVAGEGIAHCLEVRRQNVVLFPSGTTTLDETKRWRRGGFEIAQRQGIRVQPFHLSYRPLRQAAFVDKDAFIPHLWKLLGEEKIEVVVEFKSPQVVENPDLDSAKLWEASKQWLDSTR